MSILSRFLVSPRSRRIASDLYGKAVLQARQPAFYEVYGVADRLEQRFDLVALHVHLICRALSTETGRAKAVTQALFDTMCTDLDFNLRELGAGDTSIGKKMKVMAQAYYGRAEACEAGLAAADPDVLATTLARNLTLAPAKAAPVADYVRRAARALQGTGADQIMAGNWTFPPVTQPELTP